LLLIIIKCIEVIFDIQDVIDMEASNQKVTYSAKQRELLRKKIRKFFGTRPADHASCAVRDVFAPSVDKWSMFCLYFLAYNGTLRFNKLKNFIPDISSRMLSVTLKRMEKNGIVQRKVFAEVPPRVEYKLTPFGLGFADKLLDLNIWVNDQIEK